MGAAVILVENTNYGNILVCITSFNQAHGPN